MQNLPATPQRPPISVPAAVPQVIFANWREMLHNSSLPRHLQAAYEHSIGRFLEYCTLTAQSVTRQTASNFLSDAHRRHLAPPDGRWEQAIDWFGHVNVATTQINTHVMKKPGLGVRSPFDSL